MLESYGIIRIIHFGAFFFKSFDYLDCCWAEKGLSFVGQLLQKEVSGDCWKRLFEGEDLKSKHDTACHTKLASGWKRVMDF